MFNTSTNKLVLKYLLLITYWLIRLTNKKIFIPINQTELSSV